ncbi:26S proteasome non-ATPase regulatory subunit 13-like [Halichondria panicea]|uniref:26S proteasome non-ATPase regulatory subunit 13-like n=1 Tax=Halichondria panicea TaxID=6063 RepID=UPI00312BBEF8
MSVTVYIQNLKSSAGIAGDVGELLGQIDELHSKKMWHQLTEAVLTIVKTDFLQQSGLMEFYKNVLVDFEHKINPLTLVEIILYLIREITDPNEAITFMEGIKEKVKNNMEAKVLCMISIGSFNLKVSSLQAVKSVVEEAGKELDSVSGITKVHARYYDLCSNYHKIRADHTAYYHDALHFLGCIDLADLSRDEQTDRAFSLGLAALLGKDVYNFGELLGHPVIRVLQGTDKQWLIDVMYAFNAGNIEKFEKLGPLWQQQPDLFQNQDNLLRKIRLLALMELVFRRHAHDRSVTFSDVSKAANVPETDVEMLVMKALSLGLVKGQIDEVRQEIAMHWVQPRVLDLTQAENLKDRMNEWCGQIKNTIHYVKDEVPDAILSH